MITKDNLIKGLRCEKCNAHYCKKPVYNWESDLYVYNDLSGATRCFCKKHMSYCKKDNAAMFDYEEDWDLPCFGAKLISEMLDVQDE